MTANMIQQHLPPRELWPDLVYQLPWLRYADTLNLADVLLTGPDDAVAIVHRGDRVTYGDLRSRVQALAAELVRLGVEAEDRVAFRLPNSPDFVALWLAIQWIGAIGVPIPPPYRRREIAHIVNDSGAVALFSSADLAADVEAATGVFAPGVRLVITATGAPETADDGRAPPPFATPRDRPALITYLSSADGAAKGAVQSPATILACADTYAREVLRLTASDVCIGAMSMAFAFGLGALLVFPLRAGATTVLLDAQSTPLPTALEAARATVFFAVPTLYRILLDQVDLSAYDLSSLRCCVSAAEPLPAEVAEQWRARTGLEILDGLGTTELAHIFISARPGASRPGFIGTPVTGYAARIVDAAFNDCPDGVAGRLAVRGPTGCLYWRDAEAQRRAVRGGWTLTGDICTRHPDGMIQHIRRADDLIVSGGYKISPREVGRVLEEHPAVASAEVFASPDPVRGSVAVARVVPAAGASTDGLGEILQRFVKRELAAFKCPREIHVAGA